MVVYRSVSSALDSGPLPAAIALSVARCMWDGRRCRRERGWQVTGSGSPAPTVGLVGTRRDDVLGKHREAIRAAAARNKAASIALVGSVARGDDSDDSDYDFLARFKDGASLFDLAGLKLDLEEVLGGDVDVISAGGLKDKHRGILEDAITL